MRALRATAGYSQERFADAIQIHRTSMGTLERGDENPRLATILKVKGEPLPPTPSKGTKYALMDATKNKSGQG